MWSKAAAISRHDHHRRTGQRFPHIHLARKKKKNTACPAYCAKKKQPSVREDDGGGGGGGGWASMSGRAELEEIHLLKDTGRDWRGGWEGESGGLWRSSVTKWACERASERVERRSQQARQPELLLLHCRTASDVEPALGVGERAGWIGHTADHTSPLDLYRLPKWSRPPPLLPRVPGQPASRRSPGFSLLFPRFGSMAAERRRAPPNKSQSMNLKTSPVLDRSHSSLDSYNGSVKPACHCTLSMMNSLRSRPRRVSALMFCLWNHYFFYFTLQFSSDWDCAACLINASPHHQMSVSCVSSDLWTPEAPHRLLHFTIELLIVLTLSERRNHWSATFSIFRQVGLSPLTCYLHTNQRSPRRFHTRVGQIYRMSTQRNTHYCCIISEACGCWTESFQANSVWLIWCTISKSHRCLLQTSSVSQDHDHRIMEVRMI